LKPGTVETVELVVVVVVVVVVVIPAQAGIPAFAGMTYFPDSRVTRPVSRVTIFCSILYA
jgi:hypothetical protein